MKTVPKPIRLRALLVGISISLFFAAVAAKAVYLQVYRGPWLARQAAGQYERSFVSTGKRGIIYDASKRAMAVSVDVMSVAVSPEQIEHPKKAAAGLAAALGLKFGDAYGKLSSKKTFVWLKRKASPKETKSVRALKLNGIHYVTESSRFYPNKTLASQVLGFTGVDGHGLEGLEFYYDSYLQGSEVEQTVLRDAFGRGFDPRKKNEASYSGNNLILTIDRTIQYLTEDTLEKTIKKYAAKSGLAIVMNPKTGAVLAMAHSPSFNPNTYTAFDRETWRNRAITDSFEPGSTMKMFSAAAALESGRVSPHTIFYCENGEYRIGKNIVHDVHAHGWLSLQQIVKYSSNIGAVKVGELVGAKYHHKILKSFGFGSKTEIDCPGETNGKLSAHKQWSKIDAGAISFGQGMAVSALQLVTATSAIANGGILMKPYVVDSITDPNGQLIKKTAPQRIKRVMSEQVAATLNSILQTVIAEGGTGVRAALNGYSVCGKTGTAQKTDTSGRYARGRYVASFVGFAPAEDPAVTILVVVDEPKVSHYGGTVAGPAFKRIAHETLSYLNIPPGKASERLKIAKRDAPIG